jgi:hypothetical protein
MAVKNETAEYDVSLPSKYKGSQKVQILGRYMFDLKQEDPKHPDFPKKKLKLKEREAQDLLTYGFDVKKSQVKEVVKPAAKSAASKEEK